MNVLNVVVLGIVEGLTEFLPVSSTAHLIITAKFLNVPQTDFVKLFEVFIQSGAILAVVVLYFSYIKKNPQVLKTLMVSFIPTAVIGFFLYKIIKTVFFDSIPLIIFTLFFFGLVFLITELCVKRKKIILSKSLNNISLRIALIIGLAQSLAVIPGVSRAGIVMVTMMILGYKRDESAQYSFLLAVPTILAASAYDLYKMRSIVMSSQTNGMVLAMGFAVSFVTAYIAVKWFIRFLKNNSLSVFGIYRIILAIILALSL